MMRSTMMRVAAVAVAGALMAACSSHVEHGNKYDTKAVDGLQPGVTLLAEAEQKLGKPVSLQTSPTTRNKAVTWYYLSGDGTTFASPTSKLDTVTLVFDPNDVYLHVLTRSSTGSR